MSTWKGESTDVPRSVTFNYAWPRIGRHAGGFARDQWGSERVTRSPSSDDGQIEKVSDSVRLPALVPRVSPPCVRINSGTAGQKFRLKSERHCPCRSRENVHPPHAGRARISLSSPFRSSSKARTKGTRRKERRPAVAKLRKTEPGPGTFTLFTYSRDASSWARSSPPWWPCRRTWRGPGRRYCASRPAACR